MDETAYAAVIHTVRPDGFADHETQAKQHTNPKPALLHMKKLVVGIVVTLLCAAAFGQGKLQFDNGDGERLIYFTTNALKLLPADRNIVVDDGFGCGALPLAGSALYTGSTADGVSPGTIMSLAGSPTIIAALYSGTSCNFLSLQTTTTIGDISWIGSVVPVNMILNGFLPGTPAWFQVQVFDNRANGSAQVINGWGGGAADAWAHFGMYAGISQIFQATPQAAVYAPLWVTGPPVNSTWAFGIQQLTDFSPACFGPGYYGAIEVSASTGVLPQPPYIWTQPRSATNYLGQNATFTVSAGGDQPLGYQWQAKGTNLNDGPNVSGSASNQLTLSAITLADAGSYQVLLSNRWGRAASSAAILTVVWGLSITQQPMSQVGFWGKSVTFDVAATGNPPPAYQWQKDGVAISGATRASLVLTNLQSTNAGRYTVAVTNSQGSLISSNAYLAVNPPGVSLALYSGITIDGEAGLAYGIQYRTNLSTSNGWQGMTNLTLDVPAQLWFDVQPATQHQRFYRVVREPISTP
jgi:hypothetical protein